MVSESHAIAVARRGSTPEDSGAGPTVVWVRGEQDIATKVSLVVAIARAAQRDGADVLVDLSDVTFMDASTIGALVGSRNRLCSRSQALAVRSPSRPARRVLELCGLADLIHTAAAEAVHPSGVGAALNTWVEVPSTQAGRQIAGENSSSEPRQPARSGSTAAARPREAGAAIEVDRGRL
jgi:anti-anti-sigma factor